ncbi:(4Fe-4S)-binding protein [Gemmatimonas sp.]|uniref:(4Fe-4S)-binding protein n=1 Tax=Gemmatimonas sp. TaxID=1962908 RepID=UPI0037BF2CD4
MSDDTITREYPGEQFIVEWRQGRCAHSGNCVRSNPRVFNPRRSPWIQTEQVSDDEIRASVSQCPSGALRIREKTDAS